MRVLAVIDSLEQGGAERSLVDLIPHLRRVGVDVDVLTIGVPGLLGDAARAAGAEVHGLGAASRHLAVAGVRRAIRVGTPDLVHTTLYEANVAGRVAAAVERVPVVSSLVNTPYGPDHVGGEGIRPAKVRAAQALDVATARLVTRFHANSTEVARVMRRRLLLGGVPIDVVPRGRDPAVLGEPGPQRRVAVRASLGLADDDWCVLAVARQEPAKGLDVLFTAVASLPDDLRSRTVVLVAGREGRATDVLARVVATLGLQERVRFLGVRDDVADLLAGCDVFVLPSRREGFPGVVVEAMAMSAPVIVTAVPGSLEALGADTGIVVPVDDAAALAAALGSVARHPAAARARAAVGRRRFLTHFTTGAVAAQMDDVYRRALGGG